MNRRLKFVLAAAPCMAVMASAAFAQTTTAATTDPTMSVPAPAPVMSTDPSMGSMGTAGTASTTTTTTTMPGMVRRHHRRVYAGRTIHQTGGEPLVFMLAGGLFSSSMLFVRRRFQK